MMEQLLFLFVPASRLDRVQKAIDAGASAVIIDLEDTVACDQKDAIRQSLIQFDDEHECSYWLRINGVSSADFADDVSMLSKLTGVSGLLLPKCENHLQVQMLSQQTDLPIIAMIETPLGVANIAQIAQSKGLFALSFGCLDLMKGLGVRLNSQAAGVMFDKIRTDLVIHSAIHGLHPPIETIYPSFDDESGMMACVQHWLDFGFGGQLLIHPKQINIAKQAIAKQDDWKKATAIWQIFEETGQMVFACDGQMVDLPLIIWAAGVLGKTMPTT